MCSICVAYSTSIAWNYFLLLLLFMSPKKNMAMGGCVVLYWLYCLKLKVGIKISIERTSSTLGSTCILYANVFIPWAHTIHSFLPICSAYQCPFPFHFLLLSAFALHFIGYTIWCVKIFNIKFFCHTLFLSVCRKKKWVFEPISFHSSSFYCASPNSAIFLHFCAIQVVCFTGHSLWNK